MNIAEKIIQLRKANGWSQEEFAEKLDVSRQAISRWENGTALPDAQNVLQISKLFGVTTDYLLNDTYNSDRDIPIVQTAEQTNVSLRAKKRGLHLFAAICFTVSVMASIIGVISSTNDLQTGLSCFMLGLCAVNATIQYVLYFKNH